MLTLSTIKLEHPVCHAIAATGILLLPLMVQLARCTSSLSKLEAAAERTDSKPERQEAARPSWTLPLLHNTLGLILGRNSIHEWITQNCEQLEGKPFTIKVLGLPEIVVVSTPEAFEDVLKHQFMNFPKGPHYNENMKDLLGEGIIAVDGVKWAHQRDVARGLFRAKELRECMVEVIDHPSHHGST
ncbi:unnamed protein product [Phytophthora fragariaefolia]|uniref:Unnamed protein product n=1 Tax=Phytophthora fragariaefolia TaxID=1490495 RepID=A0A9W6YBL5_9STRA|nr:unnamed protein product [Phytophthora fragariaefolia]